MAKIVGIKFRKEGKIYFFDPGTIPLKRGDAVICETDQGLVLGYVVKEPREVAEGNSKSH